MVTGEEPNNPLVKCERTDRLPDGDSSGSLHWCDEHCCFHRVDAVMDAEQHSSTSVSSAATAPLAAALRRGYGASGSWMDFAREVEAYLTTATDWRVVRDSSGLLNHGDELALEENGEGEPVVSRGACLWRRPEVDPT